MNRIVDVDNTTYSIVGNTQATKITQWESQLAASTLDNLHQGSHQAKTQHYPNAEIYLIALALTDTHASLVDNLTTILNVTPTELSTNTTIRHALSYIYHIIEGQTIETNQPLAHALANITASTKHSLATILT